MSTVAQIEAVLPQLSTEELLRIEQALHRQYRQRGGSIIYDDSHGVVTDADLIASAEEEDAMPGKCGRGTRRGPRS